MIETHCSKEHICFLMDKMDSVNFGHTLTGSNLSPLLHYASKDNQDMVKILIEKYKADINHLSENDETAILICACEGYSELMWYLAKKGANHITDYPNKYVEDLVWFWQEENGTRPKHTKAESLARLSFAKDIIREMKLKLHTDPTRLDDTTLQKTCSSMIECFRALVANKSDLTLEDLKLINFDKFDEKTRQQFLNEMLDSNQTIENISVFLDKVTTVNYGHNSCENPLIHCCVNNKFELVKLLVDNIMPMLITGQ